jgi:hypothetical protein
MTCYWCPRDAETHDRIDRKTTVPACKTCAALRREKKGAEDARAVRWRMQLRAGQAAVLMAGTRLHCPRPRRKRRLSALHARAAAPQFIRGTTQC